MPKLSRYSSLEEFVDKFFLILRVLRCERDHKAALCSQKVIHSAADRLERLMPKLSRYSSLEEFVDKFFLILRVLRCERDHKAALCSQKVIHSAADV